MASRQLRTKGSGRGVPGGAGPWIAAGSATVLILTLVLVVVAAMGVMQARRPPCSTDPEAVATANASSAGEAAIPADLVPIFQAASAKYRLGPDGWLWLAAFNREETDFGRNLHRSSAGAIGWMQFMPATWATYGVDGDDDGDRDPWDKSDGIFGAANYLRALGAPRDWARAAFGYNHAGWYVAQVTAYHDRYLAASTTEVVPIANVHEATDDDRVGGCGARSPADATDGLRLTEGQHARLLPDGTAAAPAAAPQVIKEMIVAGNRIQGKPYGHYGASGTHGTPYTMVQSVYDCSSSIAYILFHAGQIRTADENWVSGGFASSFGAAGTGSWLTIRANGVHVYMYVAGLRWDTHRSGPDDRGSLGIGWHTARRSDDASFTPRTFGATQL